MNWKKSSGDCASSSMVLRFSDQVTEVLRHNVVKRCVGVGDVLPSETTLRERF